LATLLEVILILEASLFSIRTLVPLTSSSFGVEASWSHPRQNWIPVEPRLFLTRFSLVPGRWALHHVYVTKGVLHAFDEHLQAGVAWTRTVTLTGSGLRSPRQKRRPAGSAQRQSQIPCPGSLADANSPMHRRFGDSATAGTGAHGRALRRCRAGTPVQFFE
jgi:hypothetical protein